MSTEDDAGIAYTVKEMLAIQSKSLERIERKVDDQVIRQAEKMASLDTRVALIESRPLLEDRVRVLEDGRSSLAGVGAFGRWAIPVLLTGVAIAASIHPFLP